MSGPPPKSSDSGFTLLEMLVVLALFSLLTVVLSSTIYLGINARARVTAVAKDARDFSDFRRILNEKLGDTYPEWISTAQFSGVDFAGAATRMDFLGPALEAQGPGFSRYDISLANENGRQAILLQSTYDEGGPTPAWTSYFAPGLAGLRIQYFGPPRDGGAKTWQSEWVMRSILPDLVAIAVAFPKGDRRIWPEIVIHPAIEGDISCEVDPNTHGCAGR